MHHIGVFDSGLGGLTVLKSLAAAMPDRSFVYLGDLARLPYGTKSPEVVAQYAQRCVAVLEARDVSGIVVACNTATASALPALKRACRVPVWGVIEPGVTAGLSATRSKRLLVLATEGTVRSLAYPKTFHARDPEVHVQQLACPLLVPLVEEGWLDHDVTRAVLREYLSRVPENSYDVVVLGCTHYPLLEKALRSILGKGIEVVDGGRTLAAEMRKEMPPGEGKGGISFLATDLTASSRRIAEMLFGRQVEFELVVIP